MELARELCETRGGLAVSGAYAANILHLSEQGRQDSDSDRWLPRKVALGKTDAGFPPCRARNLLEQASLPGSFSACDISGSRCVADIIARLRQQLDPATKAALN